MSTEQALHHLDENGLQQVKRLVLGALVGFVIPKFFAWDYGSYFAIYPMILMGLVPVLTPHVVRQFLFSGCFNVLVTMVIADLFINQPALMVLLMLLVNLFCFWLMASGIAFLAGAQSLLAIHAMVHLGSYHDTPLTDLCQSHLAATALALASAFVAYWLFPDREPRPAPPQITKDSNTLRHQIAIGTLLATLSFLAFQLFDEKDSLAAQAATLLILFPMRWQGIYAISIHRIFGTLIGSASAILIQALLFTWGENLTLMSLFYGLGVAWFAAEHVRERSGPVQGFCAMTALAIFFGLKTPGSDVFYGALYRLSSVCVAIACTLACGFLLHRVLEKVWPQQH
jgi:uncharacterized membrane protein YccC